MSTMASFILSVEDELVTIILRYAWQSKIPQWVACIHLCWIIWRSYVKWRLHPAPPPTTIEPVDKVSQSRIRRNMRRVFPITTLHFQILVALKLLDTLHTYEFYLKICVMDRNYSLYHSIWRSRDHARLKLRSIENYVVKKTTYSMPHSLSCNVIHNTYI